MHVIVINEIKGHGSEREEGRVYEKVWRQEKEERNNGITL